MRHFMTPIVILAAVLSFAGCSMPGFYQAGRTAEQCEYDLRQCVSEAEEYSLSQSSAGAAATRGFRPATLTGLCMRAKGYEYLDANTLPKDRRRIRATAPFEEYWAIDGGTTAPDDRGTLSAQNSKAGGDNASPGKPIGYRALQDESGKYIFIPVYEHEQAEETDHPQLAGGDR
ncbi:MAG: hypothetical protein ABIF19_08325 [Planctomycetota bacterium]